MGGGNIRDWDISHNPPLPTAAKQKGLLDGQMDVITVAMPL